MINSKEEPLYLVQNPLISLNPSSKVRIDALNTIKYTLLLDYSTPDSLTKQKDVINDILNNAKKCCTPLFANSSKFCYDYFGDCFPEESNNFQYLNLEPLCDEPLLPKGTAIKSSLLDMVMHHCILQCYHAVLTDLLSDKTTTAYTLCHRIDQQGIQALIKNKEIRFNKSDIYTFPKKSYGKATSEKRPSDYQKTLRSRIDTFEALLLFLQSTEDDKKTYNLSTSNITSTLNKMDLTKMKQCFTYNSRKEEPKYFYAALEDLHGTLYLKDNVRKVGITSNITDTVYEFFLTERIFGINKLYSLLKSISQVQNKQQYTLSDRTILDSLCTVRQLPNSFSGQSFIKYAFDCFGNVDSYRDFWNEHDLQYREDSSGLKKHFTRTFPRGFQFHKWLEQFNLFVNYYSKYIFPICEWTFTNMLLEYVETNNPDKTHTEHLVTALKILSDYITDNSASIIQPSLAKGRQDTLDIITKKDTISLHDSFSKETLNNIIEKFYENHKINLNLTPLNPEYFKHNHNRIKGNNFNDIQAFYLDLVRYDHLLPSPETTLAREKPSRTLKARKDNFFKTL